MLKVIKPGISSVQDLGRFGFQKYGVSYSGALDTYSIKIANLLLNNAENCPAIEINMGFFEARFFCDTWVSLTGAYCEPRVENKKIKHGWPILIKKDQSLVLSKPLSGAVTYLAVQHGFDVPQSMNSFSTNIKPGFGGYKGRFLKKNDCIKIVNKKYYTPKIVGFRHNLVQNKIRVTPGPEYHKFTESSQNNFWSNNWRITSQSNRMGLRLQGAELKYQGEELCSHAVIPGVIQVPHNGSPIILMRDAQTTGGYPRIGCVLETDLNILSQLKANEFFKFEKADLKVAISSCNAELHSINRIKLRLIK